MKKFLTTVAMVILIFFNLTAQNNDKDSLRHKGQGHYNIIMAIPLIIGIAIPIFIGIFMADGKWNINRNKKVKNR